MSSSLAVTCRRVLAASSALAALAAVLLSVPGAQAATFRATPDAITITGTSMGDDLVLEGAPGGVKLFDRGTWACPITDNGNVCPVAGKPPVYGVGGDGPDILRIGSIGGQAHISGGAGDDVIRSGGPEGSTLDAGPGNDYVEVSYFGGTVDCGPGQDILNVAAEPNPPVVHSSGCETVINRMVSGSEYIDARPYSVRGSWDVVLDVEPGDFECWLDGRGWFPCRNGQRLKVTPGISAHSLHIRRTGDPASIWDVRWFNENHPSTSTIVNYVYVMTAPKARVRDGSLPAGCSTSIHSYATFGCKLTMLHRGKVIGAGQRRTPTGATFWTMPIRLTATGKALLRRKGKLAVTVRASYFNARKPKFKPIERKLTIYR